MSDLNESMNNKRISYTFTMGAELIAYPVKYGPGKNRMGAPISRLWKTF